MGFHNRYGHTLAFSQGKANQMKIAWYGPSRPSNRQNQELKRLFGAEVEVDFRGPLRDIPGAVDHFHRSEAQECVIVAPLAVLEHVLKAGLNPLWAETEPASQRHSEAEWQVRGQWFHFVRFRRLTALELEYAPNLEPIQVPEGRVRVGWFTQHTRTDEAVQALQQLYCNPRLELFSPELRDAEHVVEVMKNRRVSDLVLVAPLSIFDALTKKDIHPIQPQLVEGQVVLRRVMGLHMELKDVG